MTDTASSSRPADLSPGSGDQGELRARESPSSTPNATPIQDDQPTIISRRSPMTMTPVSSTAHRILQGKILPGDRLGHFELVEYIGGGGMGRVFRAVDTRLDRPVALKILAPEHATDEETVLRFRNEAQSAARLDHENICRVYYVSEDQGLHFIVFELIDGINIRTLIEQKGPLSLAEAVSYSLQVAEALAHASGHDVVHRDIKPSNVLVTPEGRVKLIDMGLARMRKANTADADLTASGVTLGTFDYISPEQARDPRTADVRSDIYSLGCTLFYMLAGRPPFPEGTVLQKLLQHQGDQPPDVREFRPELPDEVTRVLLKMLAKDPRRRYGNPAELVEDLMVLAYQVGLHPIGSAGKVLVAPQGPKLSFFQRHLPWLAPVGALVLIVVLLDFFWTASANRVAQPPPVSAPKNPSRGKDPVAGETAGKDEPKNLADDPKSSPREPSVPEPPVSPEETAHGDSQPPSLPDETSVSKNDTPPPEPEPVDEPEVSTEVFPARPRVASRSGDRGLSFDPSDGGLSVAEQVSPMLSVVSYGDADRGGLSGDAIGEIVPAEVGPAPVPATLQSGLLVVTDSATGENEFSTLNAACSAAANHDVIELRYHGRREERPIALTNLEVTIRPGKAYHPVVVFRPRENEMDPVKYPHDMFTLTGGRLTLINVALELHVPRQVPADHWSLFEVRGDQTVRLQQSSLSIHNAAEPSGAYHEDVAFFRGRSVPGAGVGISDEIAAPTPPATIDLSDCIVRGEAVLLQASDVQPLHLAWRNGLLITSERLLSTAGGVETPADGEMLQLDLQHLTAVVQSGLCRMIGTQAGRFGLNTQIRCTDSIVMTISGSPLIEQIGNAPVEDFRGQIAFTGKRNFYEDFDVFWTIRNFEQEPLSVPLTFDGWKLHWGEQHENRPKLNRVIWKRLPSPDRPLQTHVPNDYALSDAESTPDNAALGAASDGSNAGVQADQLPQLPPPPAKATAD